VFRIGVDGASELRSISGQPLVVLWRLWFDDGLGRCLRSQRCFQALKLGFSQCSWKAEGVRHGLAFSPATVVGMEAVERGPADLRTAEP